MNRCIKKPLLLGLICFCLIGVIPNNIVKADNLEQYTITAGDDILNPKWFGNRDLPLKDSIIETDYDKNDLTLGERTVTILTQNDDLGIKHPGIIVINIVEPHTVVWKDIDGKVLDETIVGDGFRVDEIKLTPKQKGKTFTGWDWDFKKPVYDDIEIVAVYEPKICTVKWESFGEIIAEDEVVWGDIPTEPEIEDTTEWKFEGWEPKIKKVTGNTIYRATYTSKTNKLSEEEDIVIGFRFDGKAIADCKAQLIDESGALIEENTTKSDGCSILTIKNAGNYNIKLYDDNEYEVGMVDIIVGKNGSVNLEKTIDSEKYEVKVVETQKSISIGVTNKNKTVPETETEIGLQDNIKSITIITGATGGIVILSLILAVLILIRRNSSNVKVKRQRRK